jgi:hypothetical protein
MQIKEFQSFTNKFYQKYPFIVLIELAIAILIIAGNLTGIIPYTSTIFVLLFAWLTLIIRGKSWRDFGLKKPGSWSNSILLALFVGIIYQAISLYLIEPFLSSLTGELPDVGSFKSLTGNMQLTVIWILISWTLAAFGEEMVYRGYFMHGFTDLFKNEKTGRIFSVILSSVLFGLVHLYQGLSGMISVGLFGLMFALVYFASGRNLWAPILAHGISDTLGFIIIYFGVYPGL